MAIREIAARSPIAPLLPATADVGILRSALHNVLRPMAETVSLCADWVEHRQRAVTAAYSVQDETVIIADATGGAFSVTLPPSTSSTINRDIRVKRINSGANAVTIAASGSDLIDGSGTSVLAAQYAVLHVISDGAGNWWVI